jgi:chemotaxis protein MotB
VRRWRRWWPTCAPRANTDAAALEAAKAEITEAEAARLADAAALEALRDRLEGADTELTAMTLALEAERKRAEETLTLLAAARTEAARGAEVVDLKDAALAAAEAALAGRAGKGPGRRARGRVAEPADRGACGQLGSLQQVLDEAGRKGRRGQGATRSLGAELNAALAQVAAEQKARAELEEAERQRLEAENKDLARSGRNSSASFPLAGGPRGRAGGGRPLRLLLRGAVRTPALPTWPPKAGRRSPAWSASWTRCAAKIPPGIDWIIRVDGHTDNVPLSGGGALPTTGN